ncbi:MAG: aminotransferase class I/II-fold pyridoxal phosphate-dependent enzyme, partial [Pseudomonadota bacterium]
HSDLIGAFNKVRNHFGMSRIAQAGALAALKDTRYLTSVISEVAQARARIDKIASAQGLETLASATNFVAMDCGQDGEFARRVLTELVARDVFVRMPFVAPQDRCIRIGVGTKADLDFLELQLPMALEAASEG